MSPEYICQRCHNVTFDLKDTRHGGAVIICKHCGMKMERIVEQNDQ